MWHQALDSRHSIRCLFVDFSKAFDHVDHSTVMEKLADLNIHPFFLRWLHSFLLNRLQRVKIGDSVSQWARLNGGMPQGTWLGPYVFLVLINDLTSTIPLHKFIDDVTATEIIDQGASSHMQSVVDQIKAWSSSNFMIVNQKKTKEMIIGAIQHDPPSPVKFNDDNVECVTSFKLLGVTIDNNLKWDSHVNLVCLKANKRLHFLKLLKRSSMSVEDLLHYYKSVIRPVLEYACPVWQSSLSACQLSHLESIQRRALRIILSNVDEYGIQCAMCDLDTISVRLDYLAQSFFKRICRSNDCINYLLPLDDRCLTQTLRYVFKFQSYYCRTELFKRSFIPYSIDNYQ